MEKNKAKIVVQFTLMVKECKIIKITLLLLEYALGYHIFL